MQNLAPDAPESEGYAINDADEVVGYIQPTPDVEPTAAALWKDGTTILLNTLAGYEQTGEAVAINNAGWAAGDVCGTAGCTAFVYDGKKMFDLNARSKTAGWSLQRATGINDSGVIIGTGMHKGKLHAFMAIPR